MPMADIAIRPVRFTHKGNKTMLFDLSQYVSGNAAIMALIAVAIALAVSFDKKGN